ncbi:MAG TPA: molybdopterin cofactor-binding domain-containing protein [Oligoflexus sp.]|uniref:xanthine dehydrogenase family protein molybdopterin-binding subunit n=1 Tax=Oligoflexus sp. TaxID=1971216 RepID=UPI002D58161F|nr:molybdopterin cofactor-binding domain-containing protein [Oligoflexus sp.]HYX31760.1 molybdopterin cofactor-binding domain-containing protein [Oligoflexus sp.]
MQKIISSRRTFLEGVGVSAVGLFFGLYAYADQPTNEPAGDTDPKPKTSSAAVEKTSVGLNPNVFIHVAPDGWVTIVCHRSEMGQGIRSSLPVLLADELGASMQKVKIVQAVGDKAYGDQNTDGSNSIRGIYEDMRTAAATARMMLIGAAATRWKVAADTCTTDNHAVIHGPSKRQLGFGDIAVEAGRMRIPQPAEVKLRPTQELKNVGKDLPLLDGPAYVTGKAVFGADLRLPNMLVAVIARPPVVGGKAGKFEAKAARAVPGVKQVIELPLPKQPYMFQPWGGVAVLAENTWAAMKGRDALKVNWESGPNASYNSADYRKSLLASVRKPGTPLRKLGNTESALAEAAKTIEAEYYVPHLPHVAMEPPTALAHYRRDKGGSCEVWAPTQNPQAARTEVARVLGLDESRVTVHVTLLGGGFGRKSKADFVSEAAFLSKAAGVPVRVQFTREDDIHNDYLNTVSAQHLTAGLDKNGKVIAWRHRTAFPPIGSLFNPQTKRPGLGDLQQGVLDVPLAIPHISAEACEAESHVRTGWLRSVYNIFHAFAVNSFIDEIAHARGQDPRETMLEIFGPARTVPLAELGVEQLQNYGASLEKHPVDAGRLRHVVERVTQNAGWANRKNLKNRALGLAAHRSFLSYVGVVAAVTRNDGGTLRVDEAWLVVDAGTIINTDRVRAQMEGSLINGMSHAFYGGVTHKNGAVEQNNFDGVRLIRMGEEPTKIHIEIVKSSGAPGGIGEPGVPPVAPAIANAIFALTGKRIREFAMLDQKFS